MAHLDTDLLKPTDVARRLGVSRSWVYDAAAAGRIPCVRLGGPDGPLRFLPDEVEAWLEQARRGWLPGESAVRTTARASQFPSFLASQLRLDGVAGTSGPGSST
jgi:excisionase family DNA binding protein